MESKPFIHKRPAPSRLKELRESLGQRRGTRLTAEDIAKEIGIDPRTYTKYEVGDNTGRFRYNAVAKIAHFHGVPLDSLLEPTSNDCTGATS